MDIREAIQRLATTGSEIYCKVCSVDSVDESARTVDVSPLDDSAPILGVNLQANQGKETGIVTFPKKGSEVVVAFLDESSAVVVLWQEVERVVANIGDTSIEISNDKELIFNGGENGGLVKIKELTDKVNALVEAFNSHTHGGVVVGVSGGSGAPAVGTPGNSSTPGSLAQKLNAKDYENEEVKH